MSNEWLSIILAVVASLASLIGVTVVSILNKRSEKAAKKKSGENKKTG